MNPGNAVRVASGMRGTIMNSGNRKSRRWALVALAATLAVAACQDQRDAFNPVRIVCPGDFDPATNTCRIDTGGTP
jgi:hypothetical protein